MANRHLARSLALQTLFEWDVRDLNLEGAVRVMERNTKEFAPGLEDDTFAVELVKSVIKRRAELDEIITKAAPDWPINLIAIVDRNVLRLGLYELIFADRKEVPSRVAINEAIELAKTFGGETSGKFINGVLGTVYKEMGEPGKDEVPAKKRRDNKPVAYNQLPMESLAGGVIFTREGGLRLALVHDIFGYWTLSKGHTETGEAPADGAKREIMEELSLSVEIRSSLGHNEYVANDPEKGKIRKRVEYFLVEAGSPEQLKLNKDTGLDEARWFPIDEISNLKFYDDIVPIVTQALKILTA